MSKYKTSRLAPLKVIVISVVVTLAGCAPSGPAERAGKDIDKGVQEVKDAVNPPGPVEKAGREIDKVVKP